MGCGSLLADIQQSYECRSWRLLGCAEAVSSAASQESEEQQHRKSLYLANSLPAGTGKLKNLRACLLK